MYGPEQVAEWAELLVLTQANLLEVARQYEGFEQILRIWAQQGKDAATAACCPKGSNSSGILPRHRSGDWLWKALAEQLPAVLTDAARLRKVERRLRRRWQAYCLSVTTSRKNRRKAK